MFASSFLKQVKQLSIFYTCLIQIQLEPIPAVIGQEGGYTLEKVASPSQDTIKTNETNRTPCSHSLNSIQFSLFI